jgi:hypothetical protein
VPGPLGEGIVCGRIRIGAAKHAVGRMTKERAMADASKTKTGSGAAETLGEWSEVATKELRGRALEDLVWQSPDGLPIRPLYTAADLEGLEHHDTLPGLFPFLRGPRATMYANRPWTLRQYAGFSTAEESNAFYKANRCGSAGALGRLRPRHPPRL